ncbi:MAG: hypothetical protein MO853_01420 [Candidatus Protistobacter heckmanni]|nr:hypothetical protein [Candidatus Protistobacter heckmanni]
MRRFDETPQSHAKALKLAPRDAAAWLNHSLTLHAARRHAEAIEAAEKAVELRPDFAQAQWYLSLLRLQTGDYERGCANLLSRSRASASSCTPNRAWETACSSAATCRCTRPGARR